MKMRPQFNLKPRDAEQYELIKGEADREDISMNEWILRQLEDSCIVLKGQRVAAEKTGNATATGVERQWEQGVANLVGKGRKGVVNDGKASRAKGVGGVGGSSAAIRKAETGILRGIAKESGCYVPEMDTLREFDLFHLLCGDWSPRKDVEKSKALALKNISRYYWVECSGYDDHGQPLWWRNIAGYRPPTESYY